MKEKKKDNNYSAPQVNKNGKKKFLASVMAFIIAITGGIGAKNAVKSYKGKNPEPTSQSDTVKTDPQEDLEYVFVQPFNINDEESVKRTINAVNDKYDTAMLQRMWAYFNGTLTKEDFGTMSDDDIVKEIREYVIVLFNILSKNVTDYVNVQAGEKKDLEKVFGSENPISEDSESYDYPKELDAVLDNQLKAIATSISEDYSAQFINLSEEVWSDSNMLVNQKNVLMVAFNVYKSLFKSLTKEQIADLQANQDNIATLVLNETIQKLGLKPKTNYDLTGKDKTSNGYNSNDAAGAAKLAGSTGEEETKLETKGSKKTNGGKGQQEIISNPTTSSSSSSNTAKVPEEDLTKKSDYVPGGDVVSTTEKTETTTIIEEEDVAPEEEKTQESNDYVYSDADFNSLDSKEKGLITLGTGVASLGSMLVYKKKKRRTLEEIEAEEASKSKKHR